MAVPDPASSTTPEFDVVIAGYGPTGATLAKLLARDGVSTLVVDREADIFDKPRAIGMDHEALRTLQFCEIAHELSPYLRAYQGSEWHGVNGQLIRRFAPAAPPYPLVWPPNVSFLQPKFERMLRHSVEREAHARTLLESEVLGFEDLADAVAVTLRGRRDDRRRTVRAKYLIGCDGANSVVRSQLGVTMEDLECDEWWVVIDALRNGEADFGDCNVQYCRPDRPGTYVVGPGMLRRWEFRILPHESPDEFRQPERVQALLGEKVDTRQLTIWRSAVYRFQARVANDWGRGRVFLAGDAAHQTPPHLGQGLVSGLRDAANLAWKLRFVLAGGSAWLLDTYRQERRPHFRALAKTARDFGEIIGVLDPREAERRDERLERALASRTAPETRQDLIPPLSDGLLDRDEAGRPTPSAGELFMQIQVRPRDGSPPRLFDDGALPRFQLLTLGSEPMRWLDAEHARCWAAVGGERWAIESPGREHLPGNEQVLVEHDGRFREWMQARRASAVLVRPDRYVYGIAAAAGALERMVVNVVRDVLGG
ncbi:bifunctional 3-(3-hydroxy-phenyl)propionate/3-hydroxycinnamic acid hydroxylase [Piscinibacter sp.]|uniref:bifunctional 3-(3-hydroxy-phenyl)propionate/3-hydroxycinnamic acid hydroxylase n=1 Tax=Piscinibacter sp. TaxID=1903157 RepID=UPI0039E22B60